MYIEAERKAQSAWHCWDYGNTSVHIHWMHVIEGDLYMMVTRGTQTFLEENWLRYELSDDKHPYQICLDQQVPLTGVYDSVSDTTTWTTPYLHNSTAAVILSTDFPSSQIWRKTDSHISHNNDPSEPMVIFQLAWQSSDSRSRRQCS